MGCQTSRENDLEVTSVSWNDGSNWQREVSVGFSEPRDSFHSMEVLEMDFGDSHSHPPVRTTHERHVAKVKKFLTAEATAEANSSKLLQRVLRKRSRDDPHRAIGLRTPEPTWKDRRPKQLGGTLPAVISVEL
ncbi:unnamed protein product [Durusdinium trenchii]|uniref:Uncharacterized protein n=2 Tax=Durusdinium trenchii TaxID=1381693 RepID=A0ABP0LDD8_9DINO